jgi:hypothetical protein
VTHPEDRRPVAAARARVADTDGRPLGPLPAPFAETRAGLHLVAEALLKEKRVAETGNEIALEYVPGGFGAPPWERGAASGRPGEARVEGTDLVLVDGGDRRRCPAGDLAAGAALLGVPAPEAATALIDADSAAALADWFAYGTMLLGDLVDLHPDLDPAPIRLWPEHFDVATELGSEERGERATLGASPGDEHHPEPYLYVGPWAAREPGELWNATGFGGAELGHAEILTAPDQVEVATAFFASRLEALAGD